MAGATQRNGDDLARPSAREGRLSSDNKVVRLPRVADPPKTAIADDEQRRRRLVAILTRLVERDVVPRLLSTTNATATASPERRPPRPSLAFDTQASPRKRCAFICSPAPPAISATSGSRISLRSPT